MIQEKRNQVLTFTDKVAVSMESYYDRFVEILPRLGLGLVILVIGFLIAGFLGRFITTRVNRKTQDPLMSRFLGQSLRLILILVFIVLALEAAGFGNISAGIFATAGASAVILGFAFKDIGQNFIAGVLLSFNRPFNVPTFANAVPIKKPIALVGSPTVVFFPSLKRKDPGSNFLSSKASRSKNSRAAG